MIFLHFYAFFYFLKKNSFIFQLFIISREFYRSPNVLFFSLKSQKQFGLVKVDQDHHDRSDLGLAMDLHAIEQQQFHQDHHPAVDLLGVQQGLSLEHQQQPDHHLRQHQQQQVDHTPVIRSKLEQLAYQLQNLNTSDHIQGRFHFSSAWRLNEKTQVRILTFF